MTSDVPENSPDPALPRPSLPPAAFALVSIVLWGTLAAAVGDALRGIPAAGLVFWSFLFAAPTLVLADLLQGKRLLQTVAGPPRLVLLGLWGIFGYHAMLFVSFEHAPLVEANLLNYLWPLLIVLMAPLIAREHLSGSALAGAAVGFAGAVLVVTQGQRFVPDLRSLFGYLLALGAAFSWSSFSLLLRRAGARGEGRMALFAVWSLAASFLFAAWQGALAPPPGRALVAAAWLGIGPMAIAFLCWDRAMARGNAGRIGALSYLDPLLSTLAVSVTLGLPLTTPTVSGMVLIVAGAAAPTARSWWTDRRGSSLGPA